MGIRVGRLMQAEEKDEEPDAVRQTDRRKTYGETDQGQSQAEMDKEKAE